MNKILIIVSFVIAYAIFTHCRAVRCPSCKSRRYRSKKIEADYVSIRDEEDCDIEIVTPCVCSNCNQKYAHIWNDYEGTRAVRLEEAPPAV